MGLETLGGKTVVMAQLLVRTFVDLQNLRCVGVPSVGLRHLAINCGRCRRHVMKSRAHAGSKKVAAFCTLFSWRPLPLNGLARPASLQRSRCCAGAHNMDAV